jgi:GntR family transcriptional regulator
VDAQIPTEKDFMSEYKIGRATVREAFSQLVNEGYLYKKQGIGTFVARRQPSIGLEPFISLAYSLRARGLRENSIVVEKDIIKPDKKLKTTMKWKGEEHCFYLKRIRSVEDTPIAIEKSYFNKRFEALSKQHDLTGSIAKILMEEMKMNISRIEQVIIPRIPTSIEQKELQVSENEMVFEMERWIFIGESKEPYYYLNFVVPGNKYGFSLDQL